jgi:hypothetical protein
MSSDGAFMTPALAHADTAENLAFGTPTGIVGCGASKTPTRAV